MSIIRSLEDYLEAIYVLGKDHADVRSIDVARRLGVVKPLRALLGHCERAFLIKDENRHLHLTEMGKKVAKHWIVKV